MRSLTEDEREVSASGVPEEREPPPASVMPRPHL